MISVGIGPADRRARQDPDQSRTIEQDEPACPSTDRLIDTIGPIAGRSRCDHRRSSDLRTEQTLHPGLQSRRATRWPSDGKPIEN